LSGQRYASHFFFFFKGLIDEPSLKNRTLSVQEVRPIIAVGSAGKIAITAAINNSTCPWANTGVVKFNLLGGRPLTIDDPPALT
jgi:hypothetical protein